eukprot:2492614-Alexandrium_andersonii.AAC.1
MFLGGNVGIEDARLHMRVRHAAAFNQRLGTQGLRCPLQCRRAPELAVGAFSALTEDLLRVQLPTLLHACR